MCTEDPKQEQQFEPTAMRLRRNPKGELVLHPGSGGSGGSGVEPIVGVRVARCFPWSLRDQYVSVRDKEGHEQVLLHDLGELESQTRCLIEEELEAQDFIPLITAVEAVDDEFEVMAWQVQTDHGPIELQVKSTDDVIQLNDRRIVIKDHAGGLFEIADLTALDARSQRLVEDHMA